MYIYIYTYSFLFTWLFLYIYIHMYVYIYIHLINICIYTYIWFSKIYLYMAQMFFKQQTWDLSWLMDFSTTDEQKRYELRLQSAVFIGNEQISNIIEWDIYICTDTHDIFSRVIYFGGIYVYIHIFIILFAILWQKRNIFTDTHDGY